MLECMVSFGTGIRVEWEQSGNGLLTILLQPTEARTEKSRPFTFHAEQTRDNAIWFRGEFVERQIQSDGDTDGNTQVTDDVCKLRDKIERKWRASKEHSQLPTDDQVATWSEDPAQFFGNADFKSSEQWSWNCLNDIEKAVSSLRLPFHKANLSTHLCSRIAEAKKYQPEFLESNCRKLMLREIYPGYDNLSRKDKIPLYANFERYLNQGNAFRILASFRPGLLLAVAPLLTREEYVPDS